MLGSDWDVLKYMLDTNMCIHRMKNQPKQVATRFAECYVGDVVMSAITFAELEYGVSVSLNQKKERTHLANLVEDIPVASFDSAAGSAYGPIRTAIYAPEGTRESRKDHLDKLIAAHAVSLNVVLVTNNMKDFGKYPGLKTENWLSV